MHGLNMTLQHLFDLTLQSTLHHLHSLNELFAGALQRVLLESRAT